MRKMNEDDFPDATPAERTAHVVRPYDDLPLTQLVDGSNSHLVFGNNVLVSFLTMSAGTVFELHSHPEEQLMFVVDGYCDEIVGDKKYRVRKGDLVWLPPNVVHGAFIGDVDCTVIDVFAPIRADYFDKFATQHADTPPRFRYLGKHGGEWQRHSR